jgi:hypothetical protein
MRQRLRSPWFPVGLAIWLAAGIAALVGWVTWPVAVIVGNLSLVLCSLLGFNNNRGAKSAWNDEHEQTPEG